MASKSIIRTAEKLRIVKLNPKHANEVYSFLIRDFIVNEPISRSLKITESEGAKFYREFVESTLVERISYAVRDGGDRIAAIHLCNILNREDSHPESDYGHWNVNQIDRFLNAMERQMWEKVPVEWNRVMKIGIISVGRDYSRRGIGNALLEHNIEEVRGLGCQGMIALATALKSQQLFTKNGFKSASEILHSEWLDSEGRRIFNCSDGTDRGLVQVKSL